MSRRSDETSGSTPGERVGEPDDSGASGGPVLLLAHAGAGEDLAWIADALSPEWTLEHLDRIDAVLDRITRGRVTRGRVTRGRVVRGGGDVRPVGAILAAGALRDGDTGDLLTALCGPAGDADPDPDGDATDRDALDGDARDGHATDGEATDGDATDRDALDGATPNADDASPSLPPVPIFAVAPAAHVHAGGDPAAPTDERVFFVLRPGIPPHDLRALIRSALAQRGPSAAVTSALEARRVQRVLEVSRELATQRDLAGATVVATKAVRELIAADRASCLFHDHESGALWTEGGDEAARVDATAARGIAAFAARTGITVTADRADDDPRYERAVDDPLGDGSERVLAHPVSSADGEVHAVLCAVRLRTGMPFGERDREMLRLLADHAAPLLDLLALHIESQQVIDEEADNGLFRREALEAHQGWRQSGDVLRISPAWTSWTYRVLVAACAALVAYAAIGHISEYSAGPAVIRMTGRTEVTASVAGIIAEVPVVPGQRVEAGDPLVVLHAADAEAEHARIEQEFEAALRDLLRAPGSAAQRQTVASLRAQLERARARVDERTLRAPTRGTVSDVRIRKGQPLAPGEYALSLYDDETDLALIALLPGGDRPQIAPGMPLRLEVAGYRYAYQDLVVEAVADQVIGPAEARRYLGPVLEGSVSITGPVVLVTARLPSDTFDADGTRYSYYDGMLALAEVRIRERTILEALIPALERL